MQTFIWYPAALDGNKQLSVEDYAAFWAREITFNNSRMPTAAKDWLSSMSSVLRDRLWAVRNAKPVRGRFPLVVYSSSFASIPTPWENADLCEYLASNGYVVLASPNLGTLGPNMTEDLAGAEEQARDISFLIGYAQTLANVDTSRPAVVGFSWGGLASVLAAARDNRIAALVSLDGSMRYYPGLVRQAGVHPELMTLPLMYFEQADLSLEDEDRFISEFERGGPNVLNAWTHGDLITVRMLGFAHEEFGSMYQRSENTWRRVFDPSDAGRLKADYDREDGIIGYAWIARYVLAFLDAYIKQDASAWEFLRNPPVRNGVPKHVLWLHHRASVGLPSSLYGFRLRIAQDGFANLAADYAAAKEQDANLSLEEEELNIWAQQLIDDDDLPEAISVLELNTALHPASSEAYSDLGDVYRKLGDYRRAIENYELSVARDPLRAALSKLREVRAQSPGIHQ